MARACLAKSKDTSLRPSPATSATSHWQGELPEPQLLRGQSRREEGGLAQQRAGPRPETPTITNETPVALGFRVARLVAQPLLGLRSFDSDELLQLAACGLRHGACSPMYFRMVARTFPRSLGNSAMTLPQVSRLTMRTSRHDKPTLAHSMDTCEAHVMYMLVPVLCDGYGKDLNGSMFPRTCRPSLAIGHGEESLTLLGSSSSQDLKPSACFNASCLQHLQPHEPK